MKFILTGLACALISTTVSAQSPSDQAIAPTTTHQSVLLDGRPVPLDVTVAMHVLSLGGRPQATISYTAYVRADASNRARRPVLFAFNGGPGASSLPLQFSGIGPYLIRKQPDGSRRIVENPDSPIADVDLVFIDPVGTGLSRVLPGGSGYPYWNVSGDAASVLALIHSWLKTNDRDASPVYLAGESYGGMRIARMCRDLADLPVAGLLLISPSLTHDENDRTPDRDYIYSVPTMAVAAERNGKTPPRPITEVYATARRFAVGRYASALRQGAAITAATRRSVATELSGLIGLPVDTILANNLRVDGEAFRKDLRASEGLVVGRLDTRVAVPATPLVADRPSAANDPALGLGSSNVITSDVVTRFVRDRLGVATTTDYVSLTLDVNFQWDWLRFASDPGSRDLAGNIALLLRQKPALHLMVVGGYYDLAVPLMEPLRELEDAGVPAARIDAIALEEGHSPLDADAARRRMKPLLHAFFGG